MVAYGEAGGAAPALPARFEALDSLRGVCALCVAAFHLAGMTIGDSWDFVENSWLFVDFFFVLSGFVIAASYGWRLAEGFGLRRFMLLRLGRVYPLHLAVLLAMVALELVAVALAGSGLIQREAFSGATSPGALAGSLGLIHIFGLWPGLVWNGPSWSIADEVWAYGVFALVCRCFPGRPWAVMGAIALACALWLFLRGDPWLDRTWDGSLPRCLLGFGLGVIGWRLASGRWTARLPAALASGYPASTCELAIVLGGVALVTRVEGAATLGVPVFFLLAVLVFSAEGGAISALLKTGLPRWLGRISYSIYMIHVFLLARLSDVAGLAQGRLAMPLLARCPALPQIDCFLEPGGMPWLLPLIYLALLLPLAWLSWRLIEEPGRRLSRRLAGA